MCCNKSRGILNVYKRRLIINIIVETSPASPQFTTERIQPEFSSFSLFLDDNKLKRAVHTMPEVLHTSIEHNHDIVCEQNEYKQGMNPGKIHADPPTKNLLPTSGAGRPRDMACDVTVKLPISADHIFVCRKANCDLRRTHYIIQHSLIMLTIYLNRFQVMTHLVDMILPMFCKYIFYFAYT